jgi:hypothetical protein
MNHLLLAASLLATVPVARLVSARPSSGAEANARRLFDEGRALMDQGRNPDACAKFSASEQYFDLACRARYFNLASTTSPDLGFCCCAP